MIRILLVIALVNFSGWNKLNAQIKIGVAIPLMSSSDNPDDKKLGVQMLKGINDALAEYNKSNPVKKISIVVEDTKRDAPTALQIFNKLGSDSSVIAVFGPVFSSELGNNAGAAKFHKMPIVSPTATANFVAQNNEYVFQLNPTYDIRGKIMAKYAMNELGLKNFAIFSEDNYGKNFATSFSEEVSSKSGNIIAEKYYSKDKSDLSEELDELKSKLMENEKFIDFGNLDKSNADKLKKLNFRFSYLDSLVDKKLTVSIFKLFGPDAEKILGIAGIVPQTNIDKSKDVILGNTDAIYIPIANAGETGKIIAQYFSSKINLPVLGTSDWNNERVLNENKMYIKQLHFDSDFLIENKTDKTSTNETEIRNYYFGYDGMKLILDKINEGNTDRGSLNEALQKTADYKTIHNNITIKDRTNHHMSIMIYENGELKKTADYVY